MSFCHHLSRAHEKMNWRNVWEDIRTAFVWSSFHRVDQLGLSDDKSTVEQNRNHAASYNQGGSVPVSSASQTTPSSGLQSQTMNSFCEGAVRYRTDKHSSTALL